MSTTEQQSHDDVANQSIVIDNSGEHPVVIWNNMSEDGKCTSHELRLTPGVSIVVRDMHIEESKSTWDINSKLARMNWAEVKENAIFFIMGLFAIHCFYDSFKYYYVYKKEPGRSCPSVLSNKRTRANYSGYVKNLSSQS
jgi:hypothetical protein